MPGIATAAVFGAALVLAGFGFGSPSLMIPGLGLLALAVVAWVWVRLATPRALAREPGPPRIVEDEPFRLRIRSTGRVLPLPLGELSDPALRTPLSLGPRWNGRIDREVQLSGRGRRRMEPARLVVRDPLGLCTREVRSADVHEILVLPRIDTVLAAGRGASGARVLPGLEDGASAGRSDPRAIELEVDGLRTYREGSPASRIHWPAVARTGELIERRLIAGSESAPLVVLDASRPTSEGALDAAVRAAGSLSRHLALGGGCAVLLPGDRRPLELEAELGGWAQAHARLALVQQSANAPSVARVQRSGAVFWVTARARPAIPKPLRFGGPRYLVGPSVAGAGAPAFLVSGCEGRRIGARAQRPAEVAA